MTPVRPQLSRPAASPMPAVPGTPEWLRLARLARMLSWLTLGWLGIEAGVAVVAAVVARSVALLADPAAADASQALTRARHRPSRSCSCTRPPGARRRRADCLQSGRCRVRSQPGGADPVR